jgi:hypothetical protein
MLKALFLDYDIEADRQLDMLTRPENSKNAIA